MIVRGRHGDVAMVRLAAPPLNLLGSAMIAALTDAFAALRRDPPRVAVLFCSGGGADLREMADLDAPAFRDFITRLHGACAAVRDLDAPVLAAVDGPCLGAHLEVAAACDLRIASDGARFGMPEIKVGLPSVIDAWWLLSICGVGAASSLVFDGEIIDAPEAHRIGLLNRVVAADALEREALTWAERLARRSPAAIAGQKRVLRDWTDAAYRAAAAASIERLVQTVEAGEHAEAMRAALEKRDPRF